jgi:aspartyl-tRNA(Asn)/glutamyl-tRNA(Gln) amidotransferase subunit A
LHLYRLGVGEIGRLLRKRVISARDITGAFFARIRAVDQSVNAYITLLEERAHAKAKEVDAKIASGDELSPLAGIPVAVKDNICTQGVETTCGSRILSRYRPQYDATAVARLRAADAIILGKTNLDEFGMGASNEYSYYGPVANPWDLLRVPGGSSGGSAAALAAGETTLALGTDTGGSTRQPAGLCGVVGIKPTYGRVSRYGLVAFASSLDQIGAMARSVEDCALLLSIIAGHDPCDSTSAALPVPNYHDYLTGEVRGLRIGVPREYFAEGIDPEVESAVRDAIDHLAGLGAEVVDVSLPHTEYGVAVYQLVATAEASSNLARYDGIGYGFRAEDFDDLAGMYSRTRHDGFGNEVKRRIMLGAYVLSAGYYEAYYLRAQKVRSLIRRDFEEAFASVDCLATPTYPTPAFRLGEKLDDPLALYLADIYNTSANLAGIPGISIPCGYTGDGFPVGLQLLGRPFDEKTLFRIAYAYEQTAEWRHRWPELDIPVRRSADGV